MPLEFPSALTNVIDDKSKFQLTVDDMVSLANTWLWLRITTRQLHT
jgi:hypothetical protein